MKKNIKLVSALINAASELGLNKHDINNALNLLENREYGLAFDTIITQLYEYEIEIDNEFYSLIVKVALQMEIPEDKISFMKELIQFKTVIPKLVKEKLAEILMNLEGFK